MYFIQETDGKHCNQGDYIRAHEWTNAWINEWYDRLAKNNLSWLEMCNHGVFWVIKIYYEGCTARIK